MPPPSLPVCRMGRSSLINHSTPAGIQAVPLTGLPSSSHVTMWQGPTTRKLATQVAHAHLIAASAAACCVVECYHSNIVIWGSRATAN